MHRYLISVAIGVCVAASGVFAVPSLPPLSDRQIVRVLTECIAEHRQDVRNARLKELRNALRNQKYHDAEQIAVLINGITHDSTSESVAKLSALLARFQNQESRRR